MLGLGSSMMKHPVTGKSIVRDGLVLQHNYNLSSVEPLSSGAAYFDGTDDYVNIGALCPTGNFTITSWVKKTGTGGWYAIFSAGTQIWFGLNANGYILAHVGGPSFSAAGAVDINKWHNCTLTWNGTSAYIYVDGVQVATSTSVDNPTALAYHIGKLSNSAQNFFSGYMCNIGLWSEALSQAQIKSIMNKNYAGLSDSEKTNLVSWWNLDSVTTEVATAVYDNHGGETFGSEVLNQPILTGTNWSNSNGTVSDGVGTVTIPADGAYSYFLQGSMAGSYTEGAIYKATVTVQGTVGKSIRVRSNTANNGGLTTVNGTFTLTGNLQEEEFYFISNGSDQEFAIERSTASAFSFDIHSASLKKLNGNTGTLS